MSIYTDDIIVKDPPQSVRTGRSVGTGKWQAKVNRIGQEHPGKFCLLAEGARHASQFYRLGADNDKVTITVRKQEDGDLFDIYVKVDA